MRAHRIIPPGSALGVLGSGQLGRMFAIAARRMGYRVHVLSPDDDTPTGQVADVELQADYHDLDRVAEFAKGVDVVTFEFENVPIAATEVCERYAPVRPSGHVLFVAQDREREKTYLRDAGLPVTPFHPVSSLLELQSALKTYGAPAVLKTAAWGYDGKGQVLIREADAAAAAWAELKTDHAVLEQFIDFECELSVVAARGLNSVILTYGPMLNTHARHILDVSLCPAPLPEEIQDEALEIARAVVERMNVVGVLCVEFFLTKSGQLLINETGAAAAQFGTSDDRRPRDVPVRAAGPRRVWFAVGGRTISSDPPRWRTCSASYGKQDRSTGSARVPFPK